MKKQLLIMASLMLVGVLAGCQTNMPASASRIIRVISLKQNFLAMQDVAQKWDRDAYLVDAEIPIFLPSEDNYLWLISASFQSTRKTDQSLVVVLETDGNITFHQIQHSRQIHQIPPILINDLKVDSQQAIDTFLADSDIASQLLTVGGRDSLFLERSLRNPEQPVIWRLSTFIGSGDVQHYYLDTNTGKILEISY